MVERHTKYPPYLVVLFDELCKAHCSALDKLMSLLTNGKQDCTSSKNFNLPSTTALLVIFTGNFGDRKILKETSSISLALSPSKFVLNLPSSLLGGNLKIVNAKPTTTNGDGDGVGMSGCRLSYDQEYIESLTNHDRYLQAVRKEMTRIGYSPAHIIRLGKIIPFKPIGLETIKKVALMELEKRFLVLDTYEDLKQRFRIYSREQGKSRSNVVNRTTISSTTSHDLSKVFYDSLVSWDDQQRQQQGGERRGGDDLIFFAYRQDVHRLLENLLLDCSNNPEYGMRYLLNKLRTNVDEFVTDAKSLFYSTTTSPAFHDRRDVLLLSIVNPITPPNSSVPTDVTRLLCGDGDGNGNKTSSSSTPSPNILVMLAWVLKKENILPSITRQNGVVGEIKPVTHCDNLLTSKIIF